MQRAGAISYPLKIFLSSMMIFQALLRWRFGVSSQTVKFFNEMPLLKRVRLQADSGDYDPFNFPHGAQIRINPVEDPEKGVRGRIRRVAGEKTFSRNFGAFDR